MTRSAGVGWQYSARSLLLPAPAPRAGSVALAAGALRRPLLPRRRHRHLRALSRAGPRRRAEAAVPGGQPARRRRQHRRRDRGPRRARRLHLSRLLEPGARRQPEPVQEPAVQRRARFRAGRARSRKPPRHHEPPVRAREDARGADCAGEARARCIELRLAGRGQLVQPRGEDARGSRQGALPARSLQGRVAGVARAAAR